MGVRWSCCVRVLLSSGTKYGCSKLLEIFYVCYGCHVYVCVSMRACIGRQAHMCVVGMYVCMYVCMYVRTAKLL